MHRQVFWGGVLLVAGLLLLASNFGFIAPFSVFDLWPIILVYLAGKMLVGRGAITISGRRRKVNISSGATLALRLFALWLLIGASAELLHNVHLLPYDWGSFNHIALPVLLVGLGFMILSRPGRASWSWQRGEDRIMGGARPAKSISSFVGDLRFGARPWAFESPMGVALWAGDVDMDLTTARFPPGDSFLAVKVGLGEIDIKAPEDIEVIVEAHAAGGELHVLDETRDGLNLDARVSRPATIPPTASRFESDEARRLYIGAEVMFGNIRVR